MKMVKPVCLLLFGSVIMVSLVQAEPLTLNGAGASFPYPVYSQWAYKYNKLTGTKINYQSIGSGGGIAQIEAKTVDFGASDAPLEKEELDREGLIQFPLVMGGVTPVVNITGIKGDTLKLSPEILAGIFLGEIVKWNDAKIKTLNSGLSLPDRAITVVHRADGSGTTWIFTNYLDKISGAWHEKVGTGKAVQWPIGIGGKGNEGVATNVQRINGAIGYVEYAYALQNKMTTVLLQNREKVFVAPTIESFQSAAAHADWVNAPGFYMVLTDQPGKASWPITGASFILIHKSQLDIAKAREMLTFFDWGFRHGAEIAESLHYVPMPSNVIDLVEKVWKNEVKAGVNPVWK
ncbi:phosphate ABC transporter substrate-binding protein PstS [bacterium]|nr:phosphate ABC transporter substrate-binding protein PstS [bacterium]